MRGQKDLKSSYPYGGAESRCSFRCGTDCHLPRGDHQCVAAVPGTSREPRDAREQPGGAVHNLGQTGGTSGSPVFDHEGVVVAVSFAGIGVIVSDEQGFPTPYRPYPEDWDGRTIADRVLQQ